MDSKKQGEEGNSWLFITPRMSHISGGPKSPHATTPNPRPGGTNELQIMMAPPDLCPPGWEHQIHEAPVPHRVPGVPKTPFPPCQGRMEPPHHPPPPHSTESASCPLPYSRSCRSVGTRPSHVPKLLREEPPESQTPEFHGAAPLRGWRGSACSWWLFLPWHLHKVCHCPHPGPCRRSLGTLAWWSHTSGDLPPPWDGEHWRSCGVPNRGVSGGRCCPLTH